jgi:hypothetical protein
MSLPVKKHAPTATVAAVVAWCCWPYLAQPAGEHADGKGQELPTIADELLRPVLEPPCQRDPFQAQDESALIFHANDAADPSAGGLRDGGTLAEPGDGTEASIVGEASGPTPLVGEQGAEPDRSARAPPGLVLDATYVQGTRRFAVVNGQVYQQGQEVPIPGSGAGRYVIGEILPGKVLLWGGRQTLELAYRSLLDGNIATVPTEGGQDGQQ